MFCIQAYTIYCLIYIIYDSYVFINRKNDFVVKLMKNRWHLIMVGSFSKFAELSVWFKLQISAIRSFREFFLKLNFRYTLFILHSVAEKVPRNYFKCMRDFQRNVA